MLTTSVSIVRHYICIYSETRITENTAAAPHSEWLYAGGKASGLRLIATDVAQYNSKVQ